MFLHLGKNIVVNEKDIVGIFEMDKATLSKWCRKYLSNSEKNGKMIYITQNLPKSFVVCAKNGEEIIYISPLMVSTLLGRLKEQKIKNTEKTLKEQK